MLRFSKTSRFSKDYKRLKKQGKDMKLLDEVMQKLIMQIPLDYDHREHKLSPKSKGFMECHIEGRKSDWVLIYQYFYVENLLVFTRTGSHSLLFSKQGFI